MPKVTRTDLGIIYVVSDTNRDALYLTHNRQRVGVLTCFKDKPSVWRMDKKFHGYSQEQWNQAWSAFSAWKRATMPRVKLSAHAGRRRDGQAHPWRSRTRKPKPAGKED